MKDDFQFLKSFTYFKVRRVKRQDTVANLTDAVELMPTVTVLEVVTEEILTQEPITTTSTIEGKLKNYQKNLSLNLNEFYHYLKQCPVLPIKLVNRS